jgi:hypothetical protein
MNPYLLNALINTIFLSGESVSDGIREIIKSITRLFYILFWLSLFLSPFIGVIPVLVLGAIAVLFITQG